MKKLHVYLVTLTLFTKHHEHLKAKIVAQSHNVFVYFMLSFLQF